MEQKDTALLRLHQHFPLFKEGFLTESPWVLGVQRHFMLWGPPWALQDVWQQLGLYRKNASTIPPLETVKMCPRSARAPALWEVRVTHRKKVKTTPSSLGQSFPDINTLLSAMSQDTTTLRLLGGGKSAQRLLLEKAGT